MTGADAAGSVPPPIVEMIGVSKRFPGVLANDAVDLAIRAGEVHAVLGENGAGKSTVIGMLSGLHQPDEGEIHIDGVPTRIGSPRRALALGIGTVYQHAMLVPGLTVAENAALGGAWWRSPRRREQGEALRATARSLDVAFEPAVPVGSLSLGEQQGAEIVRAAQRGSRVLILDEPTSMLTPAGAEVLGALMRRLAARERAVVFVTHRLPEAFRFADRISVLRRGRVVGAISPERMRCDGEAALTAEVLHMMFGSDPQRSTAAGGRGVAARAAARRRGRVVLDVRELALRPGGGRVSFDLAEGEILGIAGIDGNGQKELAETLSGQRSSGRGTILLRGRPIDRLGVGERRRLGLRAVSDDRLGEGTVGSFPVSTNLVLKEIGQPPFWRRGVVDARRIAAHARALVARFDIRTPSIDTPVGRLSGGNIQKVVLARELSGAAEVIIYAKPTAGLDVQTSAAVRRRIREAAGRGVATIVISTDLDELLDLSDRIAVLRDGGLAGVVRKGERARERAGALMAGAGV